MRRRLLILVCILSLDFCIFVASDESERQRSFDFIKKMEQSIEELKKAAQFFDTYNDRMRRVVEMSDLNSVFQNDKTLEMSSSELEELLDE